MTSENAAANTAPADSLHGDLAFANVNVNTTAKNNSLDEQEREQALAQRDRLFRVVVVMVIVSLVIGTGIIIAYMCVVRGRVDYRVIVAWYGGVAAQTIGVLAVMTRNLFPGKYRRIPRR